MYNKCLTGVKKDDLKINFFSLRNSFVIKKNNPEVECWETETPKEVRAETIKELVTNHKSAFSNLRNGNIKKFKMGYRTKKRGYHTITIPKSAIKLKEGNLFIYPSYIKDEIKVGGGEKEKRFLNDKTEIGDCKLSLRNGIWCLSIPVKSKREKQYKGCKILSLDPGVRTFMTAYSENETFKLQQTKDRFKTLQKKIDFFKSLRDTKKIKSYSFKRRREKTQYKLDCLIDDLHFKSIRHIEKQGYDYILLPSFESQDMMVKSKNRYLNREMGQLKHYLFQTRMKDKLSDKVVICTEEFTSKTCGVCGVIKRDLGVNDTFKCDSCNLIIDRDINGARNILLKHLYT